MQFEFLALVSSSDSAVVFRGTERILIVLVAGLAILLGWDLFRRDIVDPTTGKVEVAGWKVHLHKVGPGIFFALFGSIVLSIMISAALGWKSGSAANGEPSDRENGYFHYYGGGSGDPDPRQITQAVTTVEILSGAVNGEKAGTFREAMAVLKKYQIDIARRELPEGAVDAYLQHKSTAILRPEELPPKLKAGVLQAKEWLHESPAR